ncbi:MAG: DUF2207 domain-containing protein [Candidatus Magasanikbacteria bacterium]|nr:DUF2207 domain-containing protein [Candidatus Magasanikbacteria bacterium]
MIKKLFFLTILGFLILLPKVVRAEEVRSFHASIHILDDASVQISEKIQYDFGSAQKHGIFRTIPYGLSLRSLPLYISDMQVVDEQGVRLPFDISKKESNLFIKIGDPDKTVTGIHTYIISYTVQNVVKFLKTNDQFYWNITGNAWEVPIAEASASISFPSQASLDKISLFCYAGASGSLNNCQEARTVNPIYIRQTDMSIQDGITVRLVLPKGVIRQPSTVQSVLYFLQDNKILLLPIVLFFVLLLLWKKYGRDYKGTDVIVAQFDAPDNLTPAEVGVIFDQWASNRDVSAEIISLAIRGYIQIEQVEKRKDFLLSKDDYQFTLLKNPEEIGNDHDKKLLEALFSKFEQKTVLLSSLKNNPVVRTRIKQVGKILYKDLTSKGYFKLNPNTMRQIYVVTGFVLIYFTVKLSADFMFLAAFIISGILLILFSFIMPALTQKGVLTREYILGLKKYLEVAEKARLEFHNAPEKQPEQFEKLLPFAMVLGVEKQWAKQFEDMHIPSPGWYTGYHVGSFSAVAFTSSLSSFSASLNSAGMSGRGSSGGGRGGGGGGSW